MNLADDLQWRGLIKDKTFTDPAWLNQPKTFYLGVDCSSDSMTVGNLAVFMVAKRLLDYDWKAILLVGGATSLIGDPGGKNEERTLKSREEIAANVKAIKQQVSRLFDGRHFTIVDNYDWHKGLKYLEFLRDIGKHFSMSELIQRDFIAERIGEEGGGISYAEFSYTLIQGYDYWHLFKTHGATLQIGGSDQWGNMLSGVQLVRKKEEAEVEAFSMPLVINKSTGKKFGKSEGGAVWLDADKTSVYKFYQFWLNTEDESVSDYIKIFTGLPRGDIESILGRFNEDRSSRLAQKTLAYEITKIVHGEERSDSVRRVTEVLFGGGNYAELTEKDFEVLNTELPSAGVREGHELVDALTESGLSGSKSEARRSIEQGAVYLNGRQIQAGYALNGSDMLSGDRAILRKGKNSIALLRISR